MRMKSFRIIIGIVFLAAWITSCQTGAEYMLTSSSDCLILFPSQKINPHSARAARSYYLELSDGQEIKVKPKSNAFMPILIREEGVSVVKLTSRIEAEYTIGEEYEQAVKGIELPYKPGEAIVYDQSFVERIEEVGHRRYQSYTGFIQTTEEQKKEIIRQFKKKKYSEGWEL